MNYKLVNEAVALLWGKDAPVALKNIFNKLAKIEHAGYERGVIAGLAAPKGGVALVAQDEWVIDEDEKPVLN